MLPQRFQVFIDLVACCQTVDRIFVSSLYSNDHLFDFLRYYLVADQLSLISLDAVRVFPNFINLVIHVARLLTSLSRLPYRAMITLFTSLDAAMAIKTRPLARMPTKPMRMMTLLNSNPKSNCIWPSVLVTIDDDIDVLLSVVAD